MKINMKIRAAEKGRAAPPPPERSQGSQNVNELKYQRACVEVKARRNSHTHARYVHGKLNSH